MITEMNSKAYLKTSPDALDNVHQFFAGAAVSPFKYTEASQMQQYYNMEKKIACGAKFLITQVGWDWKKSVELFRYLEENNLGVPVLGNVFLLSKLTPAPRLMHDLKLPGCESARECQERIFSCVERIMLSDSSGTIAACSHGNAIALFINRIEPSFGFEDWRAMQNPHVFEFIRADGTWSVNN